MKAREKHRDKLLRYLSNPDNEWLDRAGLATGVLGYKYPQNMWLCFKAEELDAIEAEALENRRKRYARQLGLVDVGVLKKAQAGDVLAAKLAYQRFENWAEKQTHEVTGKDGQPITVRAELGDDETKLLKEVAAELARRKLADTAKP